MDRYHQESQWFQMLIQTWEETSPAFLLLGPRTNSCPRNPTRSNARRVVAHGSRTERANQSGSARACQSASQRTLQRAVVLGTTRETARAENTRYGSERRPPPSSALALSERAGTRRSVAVLVAVVLLVVVPLGAAGREHRGEGLHHDLVRVRGNRFHCQGVGVEQPAIAALQVLVADRGVGTGVFVLRAAAGDRRQPGRVGLLADHLLATVGLDAEDLGPQEDVAGGDVGRRDLQVVGDRVASQLDPAPVAAGRVGQRAWQRDG